MRLFKDDCSRYSFTYLTNKASTIAKFASSKPRLQTSSIAPSRSSAPATGASNSSREFQLLCKGLEFPSKPF